MADQLGPMAGGGGLRSLMQWDPTKGGVPPSMQEGTWNANLWGQNDPGGANGTPDSSTWMTPPVYGDPPPPGSYAPMPMPSPNEPGYQPPLMPGSLGGDPGGLTSYDPGAGGVRPNPVYPGGAPGGLTTYDPGAGGVRPPVGPGGQLSIAPPGSVPTGGNTDYWPSPQTPPGGLTSYNPGLGGVRPNPIGGPQPSASPYGPGLGRLPTLADLGNPNLSQTDMQYLAGLGYTQNPNDAAAQSNALNWGVSGVPPIGGQGAGDLFQSQFGYLFPQPGGVGTYGGDPTAYI